MAYEFVPLSQDTEEDSKPYSFVPLEVEASPVAPARVPVAKPAATVDLADNYFDPMGNVQMGGEAPTGTAPAPVSKSVLDKYKPEVEDRSKKPGFMVRPEYVEEVRNSFASVPAEKRRAALVEASKGSGSRALAAQRILADLEDEDKAQQTEAFLNQPTIDALMKSKGGGQPPKRPPPKLGEKPAPPAKTFFPDVSPTLSDIIDQVPEGERIQNALKRDEITRGVITANTSLEATADAVDRASRDFSAEGFAKENPVLGALASGSARSVAGMANAVPLIMDFAIQMVDKDAQRVETPGFVQDIMRKANSYMPKEGKQGMSEAWTKGEFGSWLGLNLVAQSPQMANHFVAAIVPATRPFVLPVMGVQSAGVSFAQGDSSLASVLKGLAEVGGEKVTLGLFDKSMASLSRLPLSLQAPTVQAVGQKLAAAGVAITGQHIAGALEETTTQILQNGVDRFVEGKNVGLLDQVADAAVLGALMEGPLAIPQTAAAFKSGTSEFARAFEADVAGTTINRQANDALVRRAMDVQSYDANIISPTQTARVDRAQSLLSQATSVDEMTGAAEELAGNLNEMLVPENMVTPAPDPRQVRLDSLLSQTATPLTDAEWKEANGLMQELGVTFTPSEPALTGELPPLAPGRIEPTLTNEPITLTPGPDVNVETEQQFGLDKLRMNAPRPQSIQGKPASSLTDDELSATIADSNVSAITRRSAEVELKARQSEQAPNVPAATTTTTEAIPDVTGTLGSTPVRGGPAAPVSELPGADTARANAQQSLDRWSATQGVASPIQFNPAPPEETAAVTDIAQALNSQFGTRLFAYHDTNPDAPNGVAVGGTAFVNTANVAINVSRTSLHEFKHTIEQIAAAETRAGLTNTPAQQFTAQIDSIFDDMTDAGKRAYVENFLHKEELAGITDPAAREARVQELIAAPMTRSEMTADFLGSRATDKSFWADVARADPQGFKGFVDKWLGIIDGLLAKLRGRKDQGKYESLRVDKYVQDLNRAKMVARDALVAYRKGTLQQFAPPGEISGSSQNIPGIAASARPELGQVGGGETPSYGTARQGAISIVGRHYSTTPRESLSGAYYGRGLKGAERDRLDSSPDPRLKNRIYFYVDQGAGVRPESGVGGYAHETKLDNIYDPQTRLIRAQPDFNAFESAVINAGFDGYIAPFGNNQSAVVLLGMKHKAVPVKQIGQPAAAPLPQAPAPTTLKKGLLSREANTIDVSKIPGAKLRMGSLEIPAEQTDAANAELERIGSDVRFSPKQKGETVGEYQVTTEKDGSIKVTGNPEEIRALMPEGVTGRVLPDGVAFTNANAPRVRAALEGRKLAYSRGGTVLERLPVKDGKYLGAPEKFNTPAKITTLRRWLRQLANEGAPGRYWYENSSREVLKMVGGDVQEARKFVALLAIYSPQAKVDANSTFALRAWAQYKAGQPISVKTGVMDEKAKKALDNVDEFWSGEKTGNFFFNLLREIDPSTKGKQGATIDMWMMRAGQYDTDAPTSTQYAFMENETNRLAQALGWEPQQVQAAIWVAMKARMENAGVKKDTEASSAKNGWIRFDNKVDPQTGKKSKVRVILDEKAHRDNWLQHSFDHDPSTEDTQMAKFDFGDGLKRHIGQISFEARPGRSTGVLPGIHNAPYAQQIEFQQAVQAAFLDETGADRLAQLLGLLVDTHNVLAPGVWQGEVSPSSQKLVAMAPAKGPAGQIAVDPAQAEALNLYAAVAGLVARQEGVGWHRAFYASTKRDANGLDIDLGRVINPAEAADLERALGVWMADNRKANWQDSFAMISSPTGIRLVSFGIIDNPTLQSEIVKVAESVLPDFDYRIFASSGDMPTNNWKENPNGEGYVQRLRAAGRSDVLDWARTVLAPRVQSVFDEYSKKYDWGNPGSISFSKQQSNLETIFDGLNKRGLAKTRAQAALNARSDAAQLQYVQDNFIDILSELEDSDLVKINCD